ncbi:MAG TPA: recombinase family protein [Kofleriaceae bacterium]|jgi:DNA invertase Pin-like site-specific DNA recombinase
MRLDVEASRVLILARFSSDNQRDTSIDDQVKLCREFLKRNGVDPTPAAIIADYAVSGATNQRGTYQQSSAGIQRGQWDLVIAESWSRVSRDKEDQESFYKKLRYHEVQFIGVSDGLDSFAPNADLAFGVKGLMDAGYLDNLRKATQRGLDGAFDRKRSTGGTPYGYRTIPIGDARDPDGYDLLIFAEQAAVVRTIFGKYREGWSPAAIAGWLTENNIPSPRAGKKHRYTGWGDSTVRNFLRNEKYVGEWTYNETEWRLHPVTRKRVPRKRKPNEVEHDHREELRIIDDEVWTAVQSRMQAVSASWRDTQEHGDVRRNRAAKRRDYPLSGLVVCALCAKPMTLQAGTSATYYKCNSYKRSHGKACSNGRSVREAHVREGLLELIRDKLATPAALDYVREQVAKRLNAIAATGDGELATAEREFAAIEDKIARLITSIENGIDSEYVVARHDQLVAEAKRKRALVAALRKQRQEPAVLPDANEILARVFELEDRLDQDPLAGREALRGLLDGGVIQLEPLPERGYLAPVRAVATGTAPKDNAPGRESWGGAFC